jgi:hypothetical protein
MSIYSDQRAAIKAILDAIPGIGMVYDAPKNATTDDNFRTAFVKDAVVNTCWLSRQIGTDDVEKSLASKDETMEIEVTQKDDQWQITLLYGYQDDADNPSEYTFQALVDAIEDAFRFLQNLGNLVDLSYPLQRTVCGVFTFLNGTVMCHKAEWRLIVTKRILNTN